MNKIGSTIINFQHPPRFFKWSLVQKYVKKRCGLFQNYLKTGYNVDNIIGPFYNVKAEVREIMPAYLQRNQPFSVENFYIIMIYYKYKFRIMVGELRLFMHLQWARDKMVMCVTVAGTPQKGRTHVLSILTLIGCLRLNDQFNLVVTRAK